MEEEGIGALAHETVLPHFPCLEVQRAEGKGTEHCTVVPLAKHAGGGSGLSPCAAASTHKHHLSLVGCVVLLALK